MNVLDMMIAACRRRLDRVCLFLVLAVVVAVYWPSLFHVARGDHMCFLADYAGKTSWIDKTFGAIYYNRTRLFSPGDTLLFRPLFFLILGVQNALFGYGFFWWQLVSLLSHLFVLWALWRLLRTWGGRWSAILFTAFFGLMFSNVEAVIWHGITPYVMFSGFILCALERLETWRISGGKDRRALYVSLGWMVAASFTYEMGPWYALCFMGYALWAAPAASERPRALIFLFPVSLFVVWDLAHAWLTGTPLGREGGAMTSRMVLWHTAENFFKLLKWFISGGFFLQYGDVRPVSRIMVDRGVLAWGWPWDGAWVWTRLTGLALGGVFLIGAVFSRLWSRERIAQRVLLLSAMLLGFVGMNVVGRMNMRTDGSGIECSLYYFYNFWVLFSLIIFLAVRGVFSQEGRRLWLGWALSGVMAVFALSNALTVGKLTSMMAHDHAAVRRLVVGLDKLVAERENEPGFSFYVGPDVPGNYLVTWLVKTGDAPGKQYLLAEALYPRYFNARDPKYTVSYDAR